MSKTILYLNSYLQQTLIFRKITVLYYFNHNVAKSIDTDKSEVLCYISSDRLTFIQDYICARKNSVIYD